MRDAVLLVLGGGAAFATSGPLARYAAPAHPVVIVLGRLLLAGLVLAALDARGLVALRLGRRRLAGIALAGAVLAAHFVLFVWGLERTSLPAAVSLVSLEPLSVVLCAWLLQGLRPRPLEQLGVLLATVGAFVIARGAGQGEHRLGGDLLVLGAVVLYGFYVALARALRGDLPARRYAALVYAAASVATALLLPFVPLRPLPLHAIGAIGGLALLPTLVGHTAVQAAARHLSPSVVALVSPAETLGGLAIGAAWLGARPTPVELAGALVIVAGATLAIFGQRPPA